MGDRKHRAFCLKGDGQYVEFLGSAMPWLSFLQEVCVGDTRGSEYMYVLLRVCHIK